MCLIISTRIGWYAEVSGCAVFWLAAEKVCLGFWLVIGYGFRGHDFELHSVWDDLTIWVHWSTQPAKCQYQLIEVEWVTDIWVSKITIIGSDNGLSPGRRQAIIWTNAGILLIGPLGTNFSEILINIITFHYRKCIWKCRLQNGSRFSPTSMCQIANSLWPLWLQISWLVLIQGNAILPVRHQALTWSNKVWWQCLVPTSTTRFASDVGYRMAKM